LLLVAVAEARLAKVAVEVLEVIEPLPELQGKALLLNLRLL